ncbi:MAG: hypothetical protein M3N46_00155, partial [Actinomycetota bacterium]|nr:hypothetical protein [Actinomycetota bacterium]
AEIVAQAQDAAAAELTRAVAARAMAPRFDDDVDYDAERPERVAGLAVDLADLAELAELRRERERAIDADPEHDPE